MPEKALFFEIFGARVEFGWNALHTLGAHARRFNARKALLVTDSGVAETGIPEKVARELKASDVASIIFDGISPNPTDINVKEGFKRYQETGCDIIIGVGGGSPMDAAKGVRVLASHPEPLHQYMGLKGAVKIINPMPPIIEIPTTSGTGSETSRGAVITDTERRLKCVLRSGMASLALVDPALTMGMPPQLTASTGMDALSHNIEAYLSPQYHPAAEAIAFEGIRLIAEYLVAAVKQGSDREARTQMAMASSMGALAFQKGLGATHSLSHQLSTEFGTHHGVANAILLPHTMAFNMEAAKEKLRRIAFAMGESSPTPEGAISAVRNLSQKIGLPATLSEIDITENKIPLMARNAMADWCHSNNPRPCAEEDMKRIYLEAL